MPIPASQIVQVNPRIIAAGANNLEFNGLILTKDNNIPTGSVLQFADTDGVNGYFGAQSTEAALAATYFKGYDNSFVKPRKLFFAKVIAEPSPAWLRGVAIPSLDGLKTVTNGTLTLSLNGQEVTLVNLDFGSISTFSDAAQIVQEALRSAGSGEEFTQAAVEYSSLHEAFIITNGQSGAKSTLSFAAGTASGAMGLTENSGAVLSQGSDIVPPFQTMENVIKVTQNFVNFTTAYMPGESDVLGFAEWADSKGVDYLFIYADNDAKLLQPNNKKTIAEKLKEQNLGAVAGVYASPEYAAFLMGVGASIDWNRNQAIVTAAFKTQSGLPANVTNATDASNLISQGMNFIGDYATRNDNFIFQYPGQMFGKYAWIDAYWGAVWIKNQIQAACMQGFESAGRVPYNERGYTQVRAWIQDPVNRALNNGVIDSGIVLSEAQKTQVNQEVGRAVAMDIESAGYFLEVKDPGANARVGRESPQINFYYTYGGSINRLDIPATMLS